MLKSNMEDTKSQYHNIISKSRKIFIDKNSDYGASWRVLRIISLVDQLTLRLKELETYRVIYLTKLMKIKYRNFMGLLIIP